MIHAANLCCDPFGVPARSGETHHLPLVLKRYRWTGAICTIPTSFQMIVIVSPGTSLAGKREQ
jgi:hypothetical protein